MLCHLCYFVCKEKLLAHFLWAHIQNTVWHQCIPKFLYPIDWLVECSENAIGAHHPKLVGDSIVSDDISIEISSNQSSLHDSLWPLTTHEEFSSILILFWTNKGRIKLRVMTHEMLRPPRIV